MSARRLHILFYALALALAARAEDRAPAAAPPQTADAKPADTATVPTEQTPPAVAPEASAPTPALTPAAGTSVLSKLRLPPAAKTKDAIKPPPLSPRFKQVRERIGALLDGRGTPPPPVDSAKNPFRVAGAAPVVVAAPTGDGAATPTPIAIGNDLTLLQQGAALLKVTGFVELQGRIHLTINQALYKEGDVIKVSVKGTPVFLRITKLSRSNLTLTLNDAEMTLKF